MTRNAGLVVAIVIGLLIASFPLYAPTIKSLIWGEHLGYGGPGERGAYGNQGGPEYQERKFISGVIKEIQESGEVEVDGTVILVRGVWSVEGVGRVGFKGLLSMIKVGDPVKIYYRTTSNGLMAEKIIDSSRGLVAERSMGA